MADNRRSDTLTEPMRFNLSTAERSALEACAADEDRSVASVVRRAVRAYLDARRAVLARKN